MKNHKYIYALLALVIFSCQEYPEFDVERTATNMVSGEFVGSESCNGDEYGPYNIYIFNTSSNTPDSVWIENIFDSELQVKVAVNLEAGTISAQNAILYDVSNGPIEDIGLTIDLEGNFLEENDSINFSFTITDHNDSPPTVSDCEFSARRATGFEEH